MFGSVRRGLKICYIEIGMLLREGKSEYGDIPFQDLQMHIGI